MSIYSIHIIDLSFYLIRQYFSFFVQLRHGVYLDLDLPNLYLFVLCICCFSICLEHLLVLVLLGCFCLLRLGYNILLRIYECLEALWRLIILWKHFVMFFASGMAHFMICVIKFIIKFDGIHNLSSNLMWLNNH